MCCTSYQVKCHLYLVGDEVGAVRRGGGVQLDCPCPTRDHLRGQVPVNRVIGSCTCAKGSSGSKRNGMLLPGQHNGCDQARWAMKYIVWVVYYPPRTSPASLLRLT
jgi:hypothetical protein